MSQPPDGDQRPSTSYEPPVSAPPPGHGAYQPPSYQPPSYRAPRYEPPTYQPGAYPSASGALRPAMTASEEQSWCVAAHLSGLVASLVGLPFLGPLVVLLAAGGRSGRVRQNAVEALNFSISALIYGAASMVLLLVLIGFVLLPAVLIGYVVLSIVAAVAASQGGQFRYPFTLRLVN